MANVLGTLFQDIADAIRTKTGGTGTMAPADFPGEILSITGGAEETLTTILPETELNGFALNEELGAYMYAENGVPFTPAVGEKYVVKWDGESYPCTVQDASLAFGAGAVGIGNLTSIGGTGNDEPFAIGWTGTGTLALIAFDTQPTHTVGLFQEAPAGGEWIFAGGNFTPTAVTHTVEHNLGVVPDIIFVYVQGSGTPSGAGSTVMSAIAVSERVFGKAAVMNDSDRLYGASTYYHVNNNNIMSLGTTAGLEGFTSSDSMGEIHIIQDVTETSFLLGGNNVRLSTNFGYSWGAFALKS